MRHLFIPNLNLRETFLAAQREYAEHDGRPDADGLTLADLTQGTLTSYIEGIAAGTFPRPGVEIGRPGTELWWCETPPDGGKRQFVGRVSIRHHLVPDLHTRGGHIWWSIRPGRRGQSLGTELLAAALPHAAAHGITHATLICPQDQYASRKAIETSGGYLDEIKHGRCWYKLATSTEGHGATGRTEP